MRQRTESCRFPGLGKLMPFRQGAADLTLGSIPAQAAHMYRIIHVTRQVSGAKHITQRAGADCGIGTRQRKASTMMKFKRWSSALALLALLPGLVPDAASAFSGPRGTRVAPVNDAVFEVVARGAGNGSDYWCGAAEYARRQLGAGWSARIYVARGRGQSVTTGRRSAVQFTLDPTAAGITPAAPSLSINSMPVGDNMTVQDGNRLCNRSRLDP